ncbi:MAG: DMT family transporter [Cellvibrionaceae bacterium]
MGALWAYVCVIVIWSTTPLAIKFSNDSLTPMASITLRVCLALVFICLLYGLLRRALPLQLKHWRVHCAAAIGLFPNMPLVYTAVEYIPSGLIAIMFGLTPFVNGLLAIPMLGEERPTFSRWLALAVALLGLWIVFSDQLKLGEDGYIGILLMLASVAIFCFSSLLVKRLTVNCTIEPMEQAFGSMVYAAPGLILCWFLFDGNYHLEFSRESLWALLYLAVIGSMFGFVAYFHILKNMSISTVSLIPLMTPVIAVALGSWLAGEHVGENTLLGGGCILLALAFYQGSFTYLWKLIGRRSLTPKN